MVHMIEPSSFSYVNFPYFSRRKNYCIKKAYKACAIGKGKANSKAEFGKRNFNDMNCKDALFYVAKL